MLEDERVLPRSNMEQKRNLCYGCLSKLSIYVCTTSGFSLAIRLSGVRRLEAELVEASPHLEIAPPSVHVTWWVGFLILIVIEKPKNRIKITGVVQLKWSSLKVLKHEPSQGTFSQCSEFWQADCPSRRGAPPPC